MPAQSANQQGDSRARPLDPAHWTPRRRCETIASYWAAQWGCLQLTLLREHGAAELGDIKRQILRRHQRAHFLPGLEKLGIDRNLPPAIVAARYHYLSNALGTLAMEYIEESPRKVWIRYRAPSFSFPGVSLAAVSSTVQRGMFSGWHPFNGESLGCPRLGFVLTKLIQDGEPYDEGYFEEFDRPLEPEERIQFRPVASSPDFDPAKAPQLDAALWPEERRWRASKNFARGYMEDTILTCLERYGVRDTAVRLRSAMHAFSANFHDAYCQKFGVTGTTAADLAQLFAYILEAADEAPHLAELGPGRYALTRLNRMCSGVELPGDVHHALFASVELSAKMMSARIKVRLDAVTRVPSRPAQELWLIEDSQTRLF